MLVYKKTETCCKEHDKKYDWAFEKTKTHCKKSSENARRRGRVLVGLQNILQRT